MTISVTPEFVHLLVRGGIAVLCFVVLAAMMYGCYYMGKHNLIETGQQFLDRRQDRRQTK